MTQPRGGTPFCPTLMMIAAFRIWLLSYCRNVGSGPSVFSGPSAPQPKDASTTVRSSSPDSEKNAPIAPAQHRR